MLKRIAILVSASLTLAACGPSPEARAQAEQRRKEECLNKICPGDVQPALDPRTEIPFKRNGRWFIAPREYGGYDGSLEFFWPSKTPTHSDRAAPEFIPSGPGRLSNGSSVTIQIFVESGAPKGEMYPSVLEAQEKSGNIASREQLRPGFELITSKRDEIGYWNTYIAYEEKTPSGLPALLSCRMASIPSCSTYFTWRNLSIYVRLSPRHAEAWPEIFVEILHVLNLR